jgi:hypothetical protein
MSKWFPRLTKASERELLGRYIGSGFIVYAASDTLIAYHPFYVDRNNVMRGTTGNLIEMDVRYDEKGYEVSARIVEKEPEEVATLRQQLAKAQETIETLKKSDDSWRKLYDLRIDDLKAEHHYRRQIQAEHVQMKTVLEAISAHSPEVIAKIAKGVLDSLKPLAELDEVAEVVQLEEAQAENARLVSGIQAAIDHQKCVIEVNQRYNEAFYIGRVDSANHTLARLEKLLQDPAPKPKFRVGDKVRIRDRADDEMGIKLYYSNTPYDTIVFINERGLYQLEYGADGSLGQTLWEAYHFISYTELPQSKELLGE